MRSHRREAQRAGLRHDDWSSVRERVGSRAGRRADHESVRLVRHEERAVDAGVYANHRSVVALQHSDVVQCVVAAVEVLAVRLYLYCGVALNGIVAVDNRSESRLHLVGQHVGKKAQASHVDAHNRYVLAPYAHRRLQKRAVAADRHGVVGFKLVAVEHLYAREVEKLVATEEVAKLAVEDYTLVARTQIVERTC